MMYFCPKCYGKKFVTVKLEQQGDDLVCTSNPSHKFRLDKNGYPCSKKD